MPQSTLSPTGGYSHIMVGQDYGLNASLEVLCKLWQNYSANEFECITQFILLIIKQGCAVFPFEGTTLRSQWPGAASSLITSLQISKAKEGKKPNKQRTESRRSFCSACTYLQQHIAMEIPLETSSALQTYANLPLCNIFLHLLCLHLFSSADCALTKQRNSIENT